MEPKTKSNRILPQDVINHIIEQHPERTEIDERVLRKPDMRLFIKLNKNDMHTDKQLLDKLGSAYLGYLVLLIKKLDEDNIVKFNYLEDLGISKSMINNKIRPKLKENGIVKKHRGDRYLNPLFAIKGKTVHPDVIDLFKKDNQEIYKTKL